LKRRPKKEKGFSQPKKGDLGARGNKERTKSASETERKRTEGGGVKGGGPERGKQFERAIERGYKGTK